MPTLADFQRGLHDGAVSLEAFHGFGRGRLVNGSEKRIQREQLHASQPECREVGHRLLWRLP